jgi:hypothetical protein
MSVLNPTTYLDLVQRAAQECQLAATISISTTVGQTGQEQDFCNWVNESWKEIQGKYPNWGWKLVSPGVSFTTVAGQQFYTPTAAGVPEGTVKSWDRRTFRNYLTSGGVLTEFFMEYVEYNRWRDGYLLGALRTAQVRPMVFTIRPNDFAIGLQTPLAGYTVTADYFRAVVPFAADADVPSIPVEFIMAIVYRTMMFYGAAESAADVYNMGQTNFNKYMGRLEATRLEEVEGPGALA